MAKRKNRLLKNWWQRYEYKHTTLAILSIILFVLCINTAIVQTLFESIKDLGTGGIVLSGMLFTSFFTTAPAIVLLLELSESFNPLVIALYGGIGAAIGDWIILKLFEEKIGYELRPLARKFGFLRYLKLLRRKKNRERATLLGMFAIASPLPDEIGIGLLGIAHLPTISLLVITYLLNSAGILALILLA